MDPDPASYNALLSLPQADPATDLALAAAQILAVLFLGALAYFSGRKRLLDPLVHRIKGAAGLRKDTPRAPHSERPAMTGREDARGKTTSALPTPSLADLADTTAREVMTSRVDIVALPVTATLDEAFEIIRESGHSRLPLYEEHLDTILGIVYAKDLFAYLEPGSGTDGPRRMEWTRLARPALLVPHGKTLHQLLREFQARKMHVAIVVDEYGGTSGLVTMEDILEELVGDIRDEHDHQEEALYEQVAPGAYRVDARINLDDLNEVLGVQLNTEQFEFETLGGLLLHLTGTVPAEGDEVTYEGVQMRVESVDSHRVGHVLVRLAELEETGPEGQAPSGVQVIPESAYDAAGLIMAFAGAARLLRSLF